MLVWWKRFSSEIEEKKFYRFLKLALKINPNYVHHRMKYLWQFENILKDNMKILDAGCGSGADSIFTRSRLLKYYDNITIFGVDISVNISKNDLIGYKIRGVLERLPIKNEVFDLIVCEWVLEHLQGTENVFRELRRVLRQNGYLVIITPNICNPVFYIGGKILPGRLTKILIKKLYNRSEEDIHKTFYKANTVKEINKFSEYGFKIEKLILAESPWYFQFNTLCFIISVLIERVFSALHIKLLNSYIIAKLVKKLD